MEYALSIDYEPSRLKQVLDGGLALALKAGRTLQVMGLIGSLETELDRLQKQRGIYKRMPREERRRIIVVAASEPLQVTGAWVRDVVELAGGWLCLDAGDALYRTATPEEFVDSRPDLILVSTGERLGFDTEVPVVEVDQLSECFIPGPGLYACIHRLMNIIIP